MAHTLRPVIKLVASNTLLSHTFGVKRKIDFCQPELISRERVLFNRSVYHLLHGADKRWLEKHGKPACAYPALNYLSGAALEDLFVATNGDVSLVTEKLIEHVYDAIEPDPHWYTSRERG